MSKQRVKRMQSSPAPTCQAPSEQINAQESKHSAETDKAGRWVFVAKTVAFFTVLLFGTGYYFDTAYLATFGLKHETFPRSHEDYVLRAFDTAMVVYRALLDMDVTQWRAIAKQAFIALTVVLVILCLALAVQRVPVLARGKARFLAKLKQSKPSFVVNILTLVLGTFAVPATAASVLFLVAFAHYLPEMAGRHAAAEVIRHFYQDGACDAVPKDDVIAYPCLVLVDKSGKELSTGYVLAVSDKAIAVLDAKERTVLTFLSSEVLKQERRLQTANLWRLPTGL